MSGESAAEQPLAVHAIRVVLPYHLRNMARVGAEISVDVTGPVTLCSVLDGIEDRYPMLKGTIRDHRTLKRRPFLRFYVCSQDWSHESPDKLLPAEIASGAEPLLVIGAIAGG